MKMRVLIGIVLWLTIITTVVNAQPTVLFEEESYDFGEVTQSDILEHTFVFKNTGTETLIIQKVTSS
jgi:hypothetical protein